MSAHRPEHLIKFCNAETGLQILSANSLRWSAPCLYSDPLELDHHSQLPFSSERLLQVTVQTATSMIFAKNPPAGNAPLLHAVRRWRDEERFASPEEAYEVLGELLGQVVNQRLKLLDDVMQAWVSYASCLRICSFSSKPDNAICWARYADNHRGIGIRFASDEHSELPEPQRIEYRQTRPEITNLSEEVAAIVNATRYRAEDHFRDKFTVKPDYWREEREWRCFRSAASTAGVPDSELHDDSPFDTRAVTAVYLGLAASDATRKQVNTLLKKKYKHSKLFQLSLTHGKYQLQIERL